MDNQQKKITIIIFFIKSPFYLSHFGHFLFIHSGISSSIMASSVARGVILNPAFLEIKAALSLRYLLCRSDIRIT